MMALVARCPLVTSRDTASRIGGTTPWDKLRGQELGKFCLNALERLRSLTLGNRLKTQHEKATSFLTTTAGEGRTTAGEGRVRDLDQVTV